MALGESCKQTGAKLGRGDLMPNRECSYRNEPLQLVAESIILFTVTRDPAHVSDQLLVHTAPEH